MCKAAIVAALDKLPRSQFVRVSAASGASIVLLGLLLQFVDRHSLLSRLGSVQLSWAPIACLLFLLNLLTRAGRLQLLDADSANGSRPWHHTTWIWMRVAAAHQILFMLLPSGLGDFGFPWTARRLCGIRLQQGIRLIAIYRLQDVWAMATLIGVGLLGRASNDRLNGQLTGLIVMCIALGGLCIYRSERLTQILARRLRQIIKGLPGCVPVRFLNRLPETMEAAPYRRPEVHWRMLASLLTIVSWFSAAGALWCLFRMAGEQIKSWELLLIVGGLNLCGALAAVSIGGLGVAEGALAGMLMALGRPSETAVAIALIVRPAALMNVLAAGLIVEILNRPVRWLRQRNWYVHSGTGNSPG